MLKKTMLNAFIFFLHSAHRILSSTRHANVVVYTCISGEYDFLIKHKKINFKWDYICFTDSKKLLSKKYYGAWKIEPIACQGLAPFFSNRYYKFNPHKVLTDYLYSVYLDGNIDIIARDFFKIFSEQISHSQKIVLVTHPERICLYDEATACINLNKDLKNRIEASVAAAREKRLPEGFGLSANGIMLREHSHASVVAVDEAVWKYVNTYSRRDQLAIPLALWELKVNPQYVGWSDICKTFHIVEHNKSCGKRLSKYWEEYDEIRNAIDSSRNHPTLKFLKQIPKGSSVLEFGSSCGNYTRYLKECRNAHVSICEYDHLSYDRAMHFAECGLCDDIESDRWVQFFEKKEFDYILFLDVLEHLKDPYSQILHAQNLLRKKGKIAISIPNIAYNGIIKMLLADNFEYHRLGITDSTHIRFFAFNSLKTLIRNTDLQIDSIEYVFRNENDSYLDTRLPGWLCLFSPLLSLRPLGKVFQFFVLLSKREI